ncbi:MAG: hypothetical protein JNM17_12590 [Archangium sp.]|nr:hypothetical protein [Archangium sp.]
MRTLALISMALMLAAVARHNDDSDAQLYSVVARNMVRDGTWTQLSYAPNVHAVFREHLPFGFWPGAFALRIGGERALLFVAPLFTLGTLAALAWLAKRLMLSAPLAVLALISTEAFLFTSTAFRLDAPLVCLSLLAAVAPLIFERPSWRGAALSVFAATAATLIKGPFGLVPLVAAGLARVLITPTARLRWLWWTVGCALISSLALSAFLLHAWWTGSDWWSGFAQQQLFASALGTRTDGERAAWYPLRAIGEHCWPWLPLTLLGMWPARHKATARLLTLWLALMCVALALPSRKLWHHTLIAFPACALLAASVVERLRTWLTRPVALGALGAAALCFVALTPRGRAVSCSAFSAPLARVLPDEPIFVAQSASGGHWREISTLLYERQLSPWLIDHPQELESQRAALALVPVDFPVPGKWTELSRARGWRLLERDGQLSARSN